MVLVLLALSACAPKAPPAPPDPVDPAQVASFDFAWQRIADTYPYPDFKGVDWAAAREELRPRAMEADSAEALRPVLTELLGRLGESHFQVIPAVAYETVYDADGIDLTEEDVAGPAAPGLALRLVDEALVVFRVAPGSAAAEAGVAPGWVLTDIAGTDTAALLDSLADLPLEGRRETLAAIAAHARLQGTPGSAVDLTFRDGSDAEVALHLERRAAAGELVQFGHLPPQRVRFEHAVADGVGTARFNVFMTSIVPGLEAAVTEFVEAGVEGVILDLRGNPGGIAGLASGVTGFFVDAPGMSLGTMVTREGELRFQVFPRPPSQRFTGPVAVLVDELSLSTSEILAAGLKANGRARLFGVTTGGMALPSRIEALPNGDRLQYAFADLLDPDGARVEGQGVTPDVSAPLTRDALLAGLDPAHAAAVCWIRPSEECP